MLSWTEAYVLQSWYKASASTAIANSVSRKIETAFPTSFNLSTIFKGILWMWTSLQNDQSLTSAFLFHDIIEAFYFLTAIENGE